MSVNIVALMAKHPELSKVKTRLAKTIGDKKALETYNILLQNLCEKCLPKTENTFLLGCCITPPSQIETFTSLYNSFDFYHAQSEGNLGLRMHNEFNNIFTTFKADKIILIGADIPNLNRETLEEAFDQLESHEIVFGPTDDGGYYLIGMNNVKPELFQNITWGTNKVLNDSIKTCKQLLYKVHLLKTLSDVDIESDLLIHKNLFKKLQ